MRTGLVRDDWLSAPLRPARPAAPVLWPAAPAGGLLVLSVSAGSGHVRAAQAIVAHAAQAGMAAEHADVMAFVPRAFRALYVDLYLALVGRYPMAWGALYGFMQRADAGSLTQRLRRAAERLCTRRLRELIAARRPEAIICTHFLPAELLAHMRRRGEIDCPVWVQVTDFDLHPMWVQEGMAGYFAANQEVAFRMRSAGIDAGKVHVTGIPLMPAFAQNPDRMACARALGLDGQRTTLLLMGGGAGMGALDEVAARLLQVDPQVQVIAMAGRNAQALAALQALAQRYPGRLAAQGFTNEVERSMACADLVITKAGGLTVSECLAMGLPMMLNAPIPGQEERNADFLLEQGAALKACDGDALEFRLQQLLAHPGRLVAMRERAAALGRPDAGPAVLTQVGRALRGKFAA